MSTDILGLPELSENQSAKYITHNQALRQIEALSVRVLSRTNSGFPASPGGGDTYIVDSVSGDWADAALNDIAHYYSGSWHFYTPIEGVSLWCSDEVNWIWYNGNAWVNYPTAHASSHTDGTDDIQDATASQKGLMTATQATKLDGIEPGATGDQSGADIKSLYEAESDTNAFTDAEKTKLSGVELEADVTDAVNVAASGALMAANNLSDIPTPATARTNLGLGDSVILPLSSLDPAYYSRAAVPYIGGYEAASDRITLVYHAGTIVVGSDYLSLTSDTQLLLSNTAIWDNATYATAANRAGQDFYVYATADGLILSANATVPTGYTALTSRKICGFHCLCSGVGAITGHTLTGFLAGDILPQSIWDLRHRPACGPDGMVYLPQSGLWVDIYLMSGTGSLTASAYAATITDTRNWMDFVNDFGTVGKRLLTDYEFQLIAAGSNEETNIAGSADPVTTGGHVDTAGRRMISNIGCEDCCGAMYQWLLDQSWRADSLPDTGDPTWSWYDLPGAKGSLYRQGSTGDVKLLAGGYWGYGSYCGSRCRHANNFRWNTNSIIGGRGCARSQVA